MISAGLKTLLRAQSSITDLVDQRVFEVAARQGTPQPYIVIDRVSDPKHDTLGGVLGSRMAEVDIECWAATPAAAAALAKVVSDFLDDYTGAAGSETILSSHHMDEEDTYDPPQSGGEISEFVTILNFEFLYTE